MQGTQATDIFETSSTYDLGVCHGKIPPLIAEHSFGPYTEEEFLQQIFLGTYCVLTIVLSNRILYYDP